MPDRHHAVRLIEERCKGCTNCIKGCPTEAIRVRDGKAFIHTDRCIDCGECIRVCENHAKTAISDGIEKLNDYSVTIALPAPALYGQFGPAVAPDSVLSALHALGFHHTFEVALAADLVSPKYREFIEESKGPRPIISPACPAVVKLVQVRFPSLLDHILPIEPPVVVAADLARRHFSNSLKISPDRLGLFFISPCPAKISAANSLTAKARVDGCISIADIYGKIARILGSSKAQTGLNAASGKGVGWARAGGENLAIGIPNHIAVDGIHNVIGILEAIESGKLNDIDYVEAQACVGGCVGGALNIENPFVSRVRIRKLCDEIPGEPWIIPSIGAMFAEGFSKGMYSIKGTLHPLPAMKLDDDLETAIRKMELMQQIVQSLPGLDCGSCGSPTCRALAEDVARGLATKSDCIFKLREEVSQLAENLLVLAKQVPPALKSGGSQP